MDRHCPSWLGIVRNNEYFSFSRAEVSFSLMVRDYHKQYSKRGCEYSHEFRERQRNMVCTVNYGGQCCKQTQTTMRVESVMSVIRFAKTTQYRRRHDESEAAHRLQLRAWATMYVASGLNEWLKSEQRTLYSKRGCESWSEFRKR